MTDRFFDVPRTTRTTSLGPVELPILYRRVRTVVAMFGASLDGARGILGGAGLEPVVTHGGRAVVALAFYEYLDTSVGVYNEVGTAILAVRPGEDARPRALIDLVRPARARHVGMFVVDLPVTTPLANAAGRELWGYPKFVTPIDVHLDGRTFDGVVADPGGGGAICRLDGRMGHGVPAPPLQLMTYTRRGGALIRTHVDVRGRVALCAPGTLALRVGRSTHGMAERLRALGLDGARPAFALVTDRFQSLLHEGEVVA